MKIIHALLLVLGFTACHDRDSDHTMPTISDGPLSDSNTIENMPDTSSRGVQDSSTSIGYDTSSRNQP